MEEIKLTASCLLGKSLQSRPLHTSFHSCWHLLVHAGLVVIQSNHVHASTSEI